VADTVSDVINMLILQNAPPCKAGGELSEGGIPHRDMPKDLTQRAWKAIEQYDWLRERPGIAMHQTLLFFLAIGPLPKQYPTAVAETTSHDQQAGNKSASTRGVVATCDGAR
jgi:hypothetical protein